MAKTDVWMPIFIGDYLSDTTHLTTEQHGAYLLLLITSWKMEGKLPDDDEQLAAITKLPLDKWQKTKRLLIGFFSVKDGFLIQPRLLAEYEKSKANREKKRNNGKLGGRPKGSKKPKGKPKENLEGKQTETPSPSPNRDISNDISPTAHSGKNNYPQEFEQSWEAFPKREGGNPKKSAFQAWNARVKSGTNPLLIHNGVIRYAKYVRSIGKENTRFVMQAKTFFGPDEHYIQAWTANNETDSKSNAETPSERQSRMHRETYREIAEASADGGEVDSGDI